MCKTLNICSLIILLFSSACTETFDNQNIVLTEDILLASGEKVRLSGRIYSATSSISKHGFEISTEDNFSDVILIDLGDKKDWGAFIGEYVGLHPGKKYFFRAFSVVDNAMYYGGPKSFTTLNPTIKSFSPLIAEQGATMNIIGSNFTNGAKVFFDDIEAEILDIELESIITLRIPNLDAETIVNVKVADGDAELIFDEPFEYIIGKWTSLGDFPGDFKLKEPVSFLNGQLFLIGNGSNENGVGFNDTFWIYNLIDQSWNTVNFEGKGALGSFGNSGGYFGGGLMDLMGLLLDHPSFLESFGNTRIIHL